MPEEQKKEQIPAAPAPAGDVNRDNRARGQRPRGDGQNRGGAPGGEGRRNPRRFSRGEAKPRPEFDQKIIDIRRVARVVAGGRRFNFSVAIVIGDHKGNVGVGLGKAGDTALAIEKATKNARKHLVKVPMTKTMSIPYEISVKYSASRLTLTPTPGRGIVAGSSVRSIIELAGLKDVGAKLRSGSKNRLNNARAALKALSSLTPHRRAMMSQAAKATQVAAL